jgi:trehalose 6-phosphate synthase/phosphatase
MIKKKNTKLIIISNRLPVKARIDENVMHFEKSAGGLATGLNSLNISYEKHWIGWSGIYAKDNTAEEELSKSLGNYNFHPVFLTEEDVELYYEGYCNSTLWPLFHYFYTFARHNQEYWESYKRVNALFLEKVREIATEEDIIWIQDYHLFLLPSLVREYLPAVRMGFFLHIPFPSYELFRALENRKEILTGILGADLIGLHTFEYMRHFISSLYRILGIASDDITFHYGNRTFSVETFPMGINYRSFHDAHKIPEVKMFASMFREQYKKIKIVLSVDRLDYSKGIIQRLESFRLLLQNRPEWLGKVSMVMILVPSRDSVDRYNDLKIKIDESIGSINGTYSQPGWIPIHYFYKSFSFKELTGFYYESDIALVTPLRDGMNLIAKEYVAAKGKRPGVLILSEMAGAAIELKSALLVNPNNTNEIADTLNNALLMDIREQKQRIRRMQKTIKKQDIVKWAGDFIEEMERIYKLQRTLKRKYLRAQQLKDIADAFKSSKKQMIVLDYDGTLVPFTGDPAEALPDPSLLQILKDLTSIKTLDLAIISGRNRSFLDQIFGSFDIIIFAEHGALRRIDKTWESVYRKSLVWQNEILRIIQGVTENTPGSFIERKETAVVWHYRNCDKWLSDVRVSQLINKLIYPCTKRHLQLMKGNKIVEVKPSEYTKGTAISNFFDCSKYDFILAAGDDTTDEDMFDVLPDSAITIKIGNPSDKSRYTLEKSDSLIKFLKLLTK